MIVVTGGAGFIGSALVWKLNQQGRSDILVVDRMGTGAKWKNLAKRNIAGLLHKDEFLPWLEGDGANAHIEAIFHLGASSATTETDVDYLVRNNLNYSLRLWHYCADMKSRSSTLPPPPPMVTGCMVLMTTKPSSPSSRRSIPTASANKSLMT